MIDINKKYKTREGQKVRIYATDGAGDYPIHGAIKASTGWENWVWSKNGNFLVSGEENEYDLVEIPTFEDKEPVWCWNNALMFTRILRFWDNENMCTFSNSGKRNGYVYDNYAKVEHIEKWMIEVQKQLRID